MSDYSFIKEFQEIKISKYCRDNNINIGNLLSGCTTSENYKKVKNYIVEQLLELMKKYKKDELLISGLYFEMFEKLEKENIHLREMI